MMQRALRWLIVYVASLAVMSVVLIPTVWLLVGPHVGLLPIGWTQPVLALAWVLWMLLPLAIARRALNRPPYGVTSSRR
jgi:hypothetical protein